MQKYHIVLVPTAKVAFAAELFAQTHFVHNHEGYCIGENGHLPHITIAQVNIPDAFEIDDLYAAFLKLDWSEEHALIFGNYYHNERHYCGVEIVKSDKLQMLYENTIEAINHLGLAVEGETGNGFWPHMTFAKTHISLPESVMLPDQLRDKTGGWRLEFGHRGDHGVYLGRYEPA
jgi:2'-5' RNA ligase